MTGLSAALVVGLHQDAVSLRSHRQRDLGKVGKPRSPVAQSLAEADTLTERGLHLAAAFVAARALLVPWTLRSGVPIGPAEREELAREYAAASRHPGSVPLDRYPRLADYGFDEQIRRLRPALEKRVANLPVGQAHLGVALLRMVDSL